LGNALGAVADAGLNATNEVIVTPSSAFDGKPFLSPDRFITDALTVNATILSSSFSGWDYLFDTSLYQKLTKNGLVHVYAFEPRKKQPPGTPPPAAFVTVNLDGGKSGDGIEFGVPKGYLAGKGQSDTPSGVTAQLAGLMACIKFKHPDWNWFDIKAALRTTATNYKTGYDPKTSGYGAIDFRAALALNDASQLPLFPPSAILRTAKNNTVLFAINSFKQKRRQADALFKFRIRPQLILRDLSPDDIKNLGGQLQYSGDRSGLTNTLSLQLASNEQAYFVWLTKDDKGLYSRIEAYSILGPVMFPPTANMPQFGPRVAPHISP
jgi:hypothetical protein